MLANGKPMNWAAQSGGFLPPNLIKGTITVLDVSLILWVWPKEKWNKHNYNNHRETCWNEKRSSKTPVQTQSVVTSVNHSWKRLELTISLWASWTQIHHQKTSRLRVFFLSTPSSNPFLSQARTLWHWKKWFTSVMLSAAPFPHDLTRTSKMWLLCNLGPLNFWGGEVVSSIWWRLNWWWHQQWRISCRLHFSGTNVTTLNRAKPSSAHRQNTATGYEPIHLTVAVQSHHSE